MAERSVASARLSKLGRYEVLNELGKGAMGVVYLAKDPVIGRMVAIKTIRVSTVTEDDSESREFRERFIREAQTAGILSHSNIVTIHDIGEDADTQTSFIAMEYIEGKNLKTLLSEKTKFTYDQIAEMIAQVAEALDYAHRKGIIHRDIKPANIIITTDSKVKITDFGIAKIASSNLTTTGQFLGTPNYMSPEQVSGAPVDGRSDIFSLGVVLYELLTNRKPFQGENLTAISYKIVHEDFTPPAALSTAVPPEFNPIVARAMAKDPWNRYQRGKDFALALHQLRAHLEEQRALQDLGTLVSAAENLPTMKLANLEQLLGEGETPAGSSQVTPPPDAETRAEPSSASRRRGEMPTTPVSIDASPETVPPAVAAAASDVLLGDADVSTNRFRTPLTEIAAMAPEAAGEPLESPIGPESAADTTPGSGPRPVYAAPPPPKGPSLQERIREWRQLSRREINPRWFWTVAAAIGGVVLLVSVILAARASLSSRPTAPDNAALETQTRERRQFLEEGKKLLNEGKYEQSLALFRKVLLRSPNNEQARLYAQMAENALAGRVEEAKRHAEAENRMQLARQAYDSGKYAEAKKIADEVLALDGGRVEAQTLRDEASTKLAEEQAEAAALAAKKKPVKPKTQVARSEVVGPQAGPSPSGSAAPPSASNAAATTATLRLLFESPVSEGHIMVAVNNAILLRKPFSFKKKAGLFKTIEETGVVSATIPVNPGSSTIKAWLSGPDIRGGVLAEGSANLSAGESRTLRLQYSGGNLSMRIQ